MSWAVPEIITVLSGCFSLSLVFFYLYFNDRKNYLAIWGVSWLFFVLRSILDLCYYLIDQSATLLVASHLATLTSALFLFWGTDVFTGKNRGIRFY